MKSRKVFFIIVKSEGTGAAKANGGNCWDPPKHLSERYSWCAYGDKTRLGRHLLFLLRRNHHSLEGRDDTAGGVLLR
ncbi:hypothetical protein GJAV_G00033010 [Gymnothorax javanicus]|nr:hypothetical protein GJAV_G00033010 [Gymnothorax javanicus]